MTEHQPQQTSDPLHGVTLEMILTELVENYGWEEMGRTIRIRCFTNDPSIKSSLQFLRRTPWARKKVETMYVKYKRYMLRQAKRQARAAQ
ncbi:MAG: VF530 family protein [Thermodesulfovibrionales bacterium]